MDEQRIADLEDELELERRARAEDREELEGRIAELERLFKNHGHEGEINDGSKRLQREIDLLPGNSLGVAGVAALTGFDSTSNGDNRTLVVMGTGRDSVAKDGLNNSQIYLEHQYDTDGTTNQSFFQGIRSPIFTGSDANIESGGTVMKQSTYEFVPNSLAGAYLIVNTTGNTDFDGFLIASNTDTTITITGGTFTFGGNPLTWNVFIPIYLGSATFPWRRAYVMDGVGGGLRFGPGATAGGQNGLLYSDGENLKYRRPNGTTETLA